MWLQLIGELALRQVVGRELIGVEVEGLVHGNLHTLALLVEQLHIAVVSTQRMVLREEVRLVHVSHTLAPDAHLIASLAVGIVLFRTTAIPSDAVEVVCHRSGEANAWQDFGQLAVRAQMVVNLDGAVVVEAVCVFEHIACKLHARDVEVEGTI